MEPSLCGVDQILGLAHLSTPRRMGEAPRRTSKVTQGGSVIREPCDYLKEFVTNHKWTIRFCASFTYKLG